jgi:hypothetical protein
MPVRVTGVSRWLATTLAVVAVAALGVGSASSSLSSSSYVITAAKSIGGYKVGSTYVAAKRQFGGPVSSTLGRNCTVRWPNRVTINWHRQAQYAKMAKACVAFAWAKVNGTAWRTDKGLRVGAPQSQVKKRYKSATRKNSGGYTVWTLAKASGNSLQAWVKSGRIAYFRVVRA